MPTSRPMAQPSSSEAAVISTVTSAPASNWGNPAQTGEKSSSMAQFGNGQWVSGLLGSAVAEPLLDDGRIGAVGLELGDGTVDGLRQLRRVLAQGHAVFLGGELLVEHAQTRAGAHILERGGLAGHGGVGAADVHQVENLLVLLDIKACAFAVLDKLHGRERGIGAHTQDVVLGLCTRGAEGCGGQAGQKKVAAKVHGESSLGRGEGNQGEVSWREMRAAATTAMPVSAASCPWARKIGAIRVMAPAACRGDPNTGTLTPQTPASTSPELTA